MSIENKSGENMNSGNGKNVARAMQRKYVCERTSDGVEAVVHFSDNDGDATNLPDQRGIGFEMGYCGAGPTNLAASIIADAIADELAPEFAIEVIEKMPNAHQDDETVTVLTQDEVARWVIEKLGRASQ